MGRGLLAGSQPLAGLDPPPRGEVGSAIRKALVSTQGLYRFANTTIHISPIALAPGVGVKQQGADGTASAASVATAVTVRAGSRGTVARTDSGAIQGGPARGRAESEGHLIS